MTWPDTDGATNEGFTISCKSAGCWRGHAGDLWAVTPLDDRNWQPSTLRDRGAAVPFTSPMLSGARARIAERRLDLLVPHPGGARGVYIFALGSLTEFCTPTLHDIRLADRLAALAPLSPATIRQAARAVAAEGAAGRSAAAAAVTAAEHDERRRRGFELALLSVLAGDGDLAAGASPGDDEQRARQAVQRLSSRTGRDVEAVQRDIGLLSSLLAGSGLDGIARPGSTPQKGRCAVLLDAVAALRTGMLAWVEAAGPRPACTQVTTVAAAMHAAGRLLLASTQQLLDCPDTLLHVWAAGPEGVAARICRPDWFLDGWEQLCLLWQVAETDDERAEACAEIAALLPPVPGEAEAWLGQAPPRLIAQLRAPRPPSPPTGAPASHVVALIARNERIRALAA